MPTGVVMIHHHHCNDPSSSLSSPPFITQHMYDMIDSTIITITTITTEHRYDVIDSGALPNSGGEKLKMCLLVKTSLGRIRRFYIHHHHHQIHQHHHLHHLHQVASGPVPGSWTLQFREHLAPPSSFHCSSFSSSSYYLDPPAPFPPSPLTQKYNSDLAFSFTLNTP